MFVVAYVDDAAVVVEITKSGDKQKTCVKTKARSAFSGLSKEHELRNARKGAAFS